MRIIIFTDSLGRPRPDIDKNEYTHYEDVYGYKLKKYFQDDEVELLYIESLDTEDAIFWSQRMVAFRAPDIVIFHLGINDCAPRLFKKHSSSILLNPLFRKITFNVFLKTVSYFRYIFTKIRPIVYVDKKNFEENWKKIIDEISQYNPQVQCLALGIAKSNIMNQRSYGYNRNVIEYNSILQKLFGRNYIEINEVLEEGNFISDNIHLTKEGHNKLYRVLRQKIEDIKQCAE